MSEEARKEAEAIGYILRQKLNNYPMAITEVDQITGINKAPTMTPPPNFSNISLQEMGQQTMRW